MGKAATEIINEAKIDDQVEIPTPPLATIKENKKQNEIVISMNA